MKGTQLLYIVKGRIAHTICNFQEYGINTPENQFLKLVLEFVSSYLSQNRRFFGTSQNARLQQILNYCMPSFQQVQTWEKKHQKPLVSKNVFYKEYEEAVKIGGFILQRFSFNINKASQMQTTTPPFWIDMSKLFELYVYSKLRKLFTSPLAITYHDDFLGGKQTDILIREKSHRCVIDCKYKPRYQNQNPSLDDKRQLAGYTRLKSVYNKLGVPDTEIIKGLIIYSSQHCDADIAPGDLFSQPIKE